VAITNLDQAGDDAALVVNPCLYPIPDARGFGTRQGTLDDREEQKER
jgi:hypothetical protein